MFHIRLENQVVVTLSWGGPTQSGTYKASCTVCVDGDRSDIYLVMLKTLCTEDYKIIRQLASMLYREYRCRIVAIRKSPLCLEMTTMDLNMLENLQDNISLLENNFKNTFGEKMSFIFDLRVQLPSGENSASCSLTIQDIQETQTSETPMYVYR